MSGGIGTVDERSTQGVFMNADKDSWDLVLAHYLAQSISLARAAELLELSPFELRTRFQRLDVPLRMGVRDVAEARADLETARNSLEDSAE